VADQVNATREKLIEGAIRVLAAEGVSGTTTRKIADAAGVRLASLHYHFKDKDTLLFEVLKKVTLDLEKFLEEEVGRAADINESIKELIAALWRLVNKTRDLQIVQYEMTMYAIRRENTAWLAQKQYEGYVQQYEKILSQCRTTHLDRRHTTELAEFLLVGIDGVLLQHLANPNDMRSARSLSFLIEAAQALAKRMVRRSPVPGDTDNRPPARTVDRLRPSGRR
jgi:AcrR family transcriptional regulator